MRARLDACLLDDDILANRHAWSSLNNPVVSHWSADALTVPCGPLS